MATIYDISGNGTAAGLLGMWAADPTDDGVRLVLADFLEESGITYDVDETLRMHGLPTTVEQVRALTPERVAALLPELRALGFGTWRQHLERLFGKLPRRRRAPKA